MAGLVRIPNQSCRRQRLGTFEVWVLEAPALPLSTKLPITKLKKFPLSLISHEPGLGEEVMEEGTRLACPSQSCILITQDVENTYEVSSSLQSNWTLT